MKRLLLFDIDGTLVDTRGAGLQALRDAVLEAFSLHHRTGDMPALDLGGATDAAVIRQLFTAFEVVDSPENRETFLVCYLQHLERWLEELAEKRPLRGADTLLMELAHRPGEFSLGLLTGNVEDGARAKLRHVQLDHHFRFGAFGTDRETRNELGPVALDRAKAVTGKAFDPAETVIIGDTPKDVDCARAFGAHCIAVATGTISREDLAASGPDGLLEDLSDTDAFIGAIARL